MCAEWDKFDLVLGFCLDVMHQFDEGVAKYFLDQLMDDSTTTLDVTHKQRCDVDQLWMQIKLPGQSDRVPRSLTEFKRFKAHELRFFLHFGLPFITKGIVSAKARKINFSSSRCCQIVSV